MSCQNDVCPFEVVNISVVNGPILKDYYYKSLDIVGLNKTLLQLQTNGEGTAHLRIPTMPLYSQSIKIIFHILNQDQRVKSWSLKRIKLCDCAIVQKAVGINNFRKVFDCPHRELLHIWPTSGEVKGGETFHFTCYVNYGCLGETELEYLWNINDDYKVHLRFLFDVYEFHPCKCILTKRLLPVCIFKTMHAIQPIWIHNPLLHELNFKISTEDKNLRVIDGNVNIPSGSTHPLLVQFTPNCLGDYELTFNLEFMSIETKFQIHATAVNIFIPVPAQHSPKVDYECPEAPFTIYKNHLAIALGAREKTSKMVVLHNTSTMCIQYLWKCNTLKGYYQISVDPYWGTCKPGHSVSCIITIIAGSIQSVFGEIPIECEIHKFTGSRVDESQEFSLDSSIDEIKDKNTLVTRLLLNLCLRVHALRSLDIPTYKPELLADADNKKPKFCSKHFDRDIFDKLFWNFIYNEDFLNDIVRKKCDKTYESTIREESSLESITSSRRVNKSIVVDFLQKLTTQAIEELSVNWRFIPQEVALDST